MMNVAIASGKGGTGKTTVAVNLALSLGNVVLIDCDVEEPNSHIFLKVEMKKIGDVHILVPDIDESRCTLCGKCSEFCQYHAIAVLPKGILLFPELCHGCGGCTLVCPETAITEKKRTIGLVEAGKLEGLEFYHGILNTGEPMAVPVISRLKSLAGKGSDTIFDSPPGTSCPVIETIRNNDYCILVTEPTPFGLHDLKLAVDVVRNIGLPFGVIINRHGMGDSRVEVYCQEESIHVLMRIPDDMEIARLYSKGMPFVLEMVEWHEKFRDMFEGIRREVAKSNNLPL